MKFKAVFEKHQDLTFLMTGTIISFPPLDMLICNLNSWGALFKPLQKLQPILYVHLMMVLLFSFFIILRDRL